MLRPNRELRDLAFVPRWGIGRVIRRQSVAEHSFFVAHYADWIARMIDWRGSREILLWYAIWHDVPECFTSDIPGPVKRAIAKPEEVERYEATMMKERFGGGATITNPGMYVEVKLIVKAADLVDECCYIAGEMQLGNRAIRNFESMCQHRLEQALKVLPYGDNASRAAVSSQVSNLILDELNGLSKAP